MYGTNVINPKGIIDRNITLIMNKTILIAGAILGILGIILGAFAAHGLDKESALKLLTSNNAKILGIDDFVGTLEVGKDATLFISEGDALDMRTNIISNAFIQGRKISLETHQTQLWKRYSNKYKTK